MSGGVRPVPCASEDYRERNPPDKIVGYIYPSESPGQFPAACSDIEAYRAEYFAKKANKHDGPVAHWSVGCTNVSDAVHTNNHSEALPYEDRGGSAHSNKRKQLVRRNHNPCTECDVIDAGKPQRPKHPARDAIRRIVSHDWSLTMARCRRAPAILFLFDRSLPDPGFRRAARRRP
jgi:hypothetical protein